MSNFPDVEEFVREHPACGGITPRAAAQPGGGFMLTLTCACGATFDRWVTLDEAREPLPPFPRAAAAARRGAPDAGAPPAAPRAARPLTNAELEDALRDALAAEDADTPAPARPAARPAAPPPRPSPVKLNLDTTIRTALTEQSQMQQGSAPARPGTRVAWLALFAVLALGAAGVVYVVVESDAPPALPAASATRPPAPADLDQAERASLDAVMTSLRQLQTAATEHASLSVYSSRVLFAKRDVERFVAAAPPGPTRTAVREVLDVHLLAAAAWKARVLEQKELWEPVAQDPAIDLCPSVKRVVDFAVTPENGSRAQARGAAVASAIPVLWECAAERVAELDRRLARP